MAMSKPYASAKAVDPGLLFGEGVAVAVHEVGRRAFGNAKVFDEAPRGLWIRVEDGGELGAQTAMTEAEHQCKNGLGVDLGGPVRGR